MSNLISFFPILVPASWALGGLVAHLDRGPHPKTGLFAVRLASLISGAVALISAWIAFHNASLVSPVIGISGFGLSIRLDALSAVMLGLISSLGMAIVQFSRNYLDGDSRQGSFMSGLSLTLTGVSLVVLSGNLFHLVLAWIGTSAALHNLLLFYSDRRGAHMAARKKFIVARLSDASLIIAAYLLEKSFGSLDIGVILSQARMLTPASASSEMILATFFIAFAAFFKSAQFPTHGWLAEVMETPTPVSALLHAGIINGGAFLVVRFANVMILSQSTLMLLLIVGGFTALFASAVMVTQSSVKTALAYSSVAHMGFMLLQCGLGAFPLAIVHLVAHSFYKAHAFLSSGSAVDIARSTSGVSKPPAPRIAQLLGSICLAATVYALVGKLIGVHLMENAATIALGSIFVMGLTHLLVQSMAGRTNLSIFGRTVLLAAGTSFAFFFLEITAEHLLANTIPVSVPATPHFLILVAMTVLAFGAISVLQLLAPRKIHSPSWQTAYVHMKNGFYVNAWINRVIGATRMTNVQLAKEIV